MSFIKKVVIFLIIFIIGKITLLSILENDGIFNFF